MLKNGETISVEATIPRGHYKNQMTDEEIKTKFHRLASEKIDESHLRQIVEKTIQLEKLTNVSELTELIAVR